MITFTYLFGSMLGELVLKHADNLSRTLQRASMSAAEGQQITAMTVSTLNSMRSDDQFDLFSGPGYPQGRRTRYQRASAAPAKKATSQV